MKTWKHFTVVAILAIVGIIAIFTACKPDPELAHTHEWEWEITTTVSETQDGIETATCKKCGADGGTRIYAHYTGNLDDDYFELITVEMTDFTYEDNINTYRIVRGNESPPEEVFIPAYYNGKPVTEIGKVTDFIDGTFSDSNITSIHIPNTIAVINNATFFYCPNLTSILIPASVTLIGSRYTFRHCENLISINVDSNNPNYSSEGGILYNKTKTEIIAFPSASGDIVIPSGVTVIGELAFQYTNIVNVILPISVTTIGTGAFASETLETINMPGVTIIGNGAFSITNRRINHLTITLGATAPKVGPNNFPYYYNNNVITVLVPNGAIGYADSLPFNVTGDDSTPNWGNAFRYLGWDGANYLNGSLNENNLFGRINLTIDYIK
jgi:hypothetical protein